MIECRRVQKSYVRKSVEAVHDVLAHGDVQGIDWSEFNPMGCKNPSIIFVVLG